MFLSQMCRCVKLCLHVGMSTKRTPQLTSIKLIASQSLNFDNMYHLVVGVVHSSISGHFKLMRITGSKKFPTIYIDVKRKASHFMY